MRVDVKRYVLGLVTSSVLLVGFLAVSTLRPVQAADNDFSNGITVDSTGDDADANAGDDICSTTIDGLGECTLRAAIQESNATAGTQTITFSITGAADFTNGGEDGYTITPQTALPNITDTVIINGYSQPGAEVNTAVAPNPLNGILLIEIDGTSAGYLAGSGTAALEFEVGAENSTVSGLVINNIGFGETLSNLGDPSAFSAADGLEITGNYMGVDPDGMTPQENIGCGVCIGMSDVDDVKIGGTSPAERNLISGNTMAGISPNGGADNWIIQGNYIGVGADGETAIANGNTGNAGGLSLDNGTGTLVGGTTAGAVNVIAGNASFGVAPHQSDDLVIQGNYIGVAYDGVTAVPNQYDGITMSDSDNVTIQDNIIAHSTGNGIGIYQGNDVVSIADNQIYDSDLDGIALGSTQPSSQVSMTGNSIYDNAGLGIDLAQNDVTENDTLDPDTGPNNLLNFPTYDDYTEVGADTNITYRLDAPAGDYRIEFFSNTTQDPSGNGEGEDYLGYHNISHAGNGQQVFSYTLVGVTGVSNLAMTTTERNVATATGFGETSEFGGATPPNTDLGIEKVLLNPGDVSPGATLQYAITITNEGIDTADISSFSNIGVGVPLFYDFTPPELINPQPYVADGPFPGSWFVDVSNPDLVCLWAEASLGTLFSSVTYADYGAIVCWYAGADTNLEPGGSIGATITLDLTEDSDLVFNNYAYVSALPDDPDTDAIIQEANDSFDGISPDFVMGTQNTYNNISVSSYPQPAESGGNQVGQNGGNSNPLVITGQDIRLLSSIGLILPLLTGYFVRKSRRQVYKLGQ